MSLCSPENGSMPQPLLIPVAAGGCSAPAWLRWKLWRQKHTDSQDLHMEAQTDQPTVGQWILTPSGWVQQDSFPPVPWEAWPGPWWHG